MLSNISSQAFRSPFSHHSDNIRDRLPDTAYIFFSRFKVLNPLKLPHTIEEEHGATMVEIVYGATMVKIVYKSWGNNALQ